MINNHIYIQSSTLNTFTQDYSAINFTRLVLLLRNSLEDSIENFKYTILKFLYGNRYHHRYSFSMLPPDFSFLVTNRRDMFKLV